jgi:hypothetical protein
MLQKISSPFNTGSYEQLRSCVGLFKLNVVMWITISQKRNVMNAIYVPEWPQIDKTGGRAV